MTREPPCSHRSHARRVGPRGASRLPVALAVAAALSSLLAWVAPAAAAAHGAGREWLGEEMPLPLAVKTPQDLAVKSVAEKQYLIFNLLAGGKVAWDAGDFATAATKWETLLRVPGLDPEIERVIRPLALDGARAGRRSGRGARARARPRRRPRTPRRPPPRPGARARLTRGRERNGRGRRHGGPGRRRRLAQARERRDATPRAGARQGHQPEGARPSCPTCSPFPSARRSTSATRTPSTTTFSRSRSPTTSTRASTSRAACTSRPSRSPGAVQLLCNIHSSMIGYVYVVDSPYYAQADGSGAFTIKGVPPGEYDVEVWHEGVVEDDEGSASPWAPRACAASSCAWAATAGRRRSCRTSRASRASRTWGTDAGGARASRCALAHRAAGARGARARLRLAHRAAGAWGYGVRSLAFGSPSGRGASRVSATRAARAPSRQLRRRPPPWSLRRRARPLVRFGSAIRALVDVRASLGGDQRGRPPRRRSTCSQSQEGCSRGDEAPSAATAPKLSRPRSATARVDATAADDGRRIRAIARAGPMRAECELELARSPMRAGAARLTQPDCEPKASERPRRAARCEPRFDAPTRPDASRRRASASGLSGQPSGRGRRRGLELGEVLREEVRGAVDDPELLRGGHALRTAASIDVAAAVLVVGGLDDGLGLFAGVEEASSRTC